MRDRPTYGIAEIKGAIREGHYQITYHAADGAGKLGFSERDMCDCILQLRPRNFLESIVDKFSLNQDVYKTTCQQEAIYVKVRLNRADEAVIITFQRDNTPSEAYGQDV